jgi:hypothetical protein
MRKIILAAIAAAGVAVSPAVAQQATPDADSTTTTAGDSPGHGKHNSHGKHRSGDAAATADAPADAATSTGRSVAQPAANTGGTVTAGVQATTTAPTANAGVTARSPAQPATNTGENAAASQSTAD